MARDDEFNNFINELIDKNDILDVVREYVDLTRKGNSYWGRCPFHHEKTASFHVEERLKIYKCFGCGAAGNVIKFIQEIESVSFMEAVKILADRVGMKVPDFHRQKSGENLEEKKKSQELHTKLITAAARFYNLQLTNNSKLMAYVNELGIDKGTITAYGLGYSSNLYGVGNYLMSLGYSEKAIDDAGVCHTTPDDRFQDVMAGRIICPHINTFGKVTGFAGSLRNGDTIYTKNTDIFHHESEVFGTHLLKNIKIEEGIDGLIVTSRPIDAVMLRAHGRRKVVSVMGSNIDSRQARALMRYTDKYTILFSNVENGMSKDYSGIDALLSEGASVKVATLVEKYSTFEYAARKSMSRLWRRIDSATSLLEYQLMHLSKKYDLSDVEGKNAYLNEAKGYIMTIKERSKQEPYINVLSIIAKVREDDIRQLFYEDKVLKSEGTIRRSSKKRGKTYNAIVTLLAYVRAGVDIGEDISELLCGEYKDYYDKVMAGEKPSDAEYFSDSEVKRMDEIGDKDAHSNKLISDCIKILKKDASDRERDRIVEAIAKEEDLGRRVELIAELNEFMKREMDGKRNS